MWHTGGDTKSARSIYSSTPCRRRPSAVESGHQLVFTITEQVPVNIEGRTNVLMTHPSLYLKRIATLIDHERRRSVPQLVESEWSQISPIYGRDPRRVFGNCHTGGTLRVARRKPRCHLGRLQDGDSACLEERLGFSKFAVQVKPWEIVVDSDRKHWVSVAAAIFDGDRVLSIRRRDNEKWEPP